MNTLQRIFVACFCGATIGALLAIQFSHYFWWVGILLGGLVGYLSYEFKAVASAIKTSRQAVWRELTVQQYRPTLPWKEVKIMIWVFKEIVLMMLLICISFLMVFVAGTSWALIIHFFNLYPEGATYAGVTGICSFPAIGIAAFICGKLDMSDNANGIHIMKAASRGLLYGNSIILLCCLLPRTILWIIRKVPFIATFLGQVAKRTFILIHSEIRLLCMTDAMLGALAGYFCGNALIGGVAGAILGVLNYKLVSVRWLKLVRA